MIWMLLAGLSGALLRLWPRTAVLSVCAPGLIAISFVVLTGDWVSPIATYAAWGVGVAIGYLIDHLRNR